MTHTSRGFGWRIHCGVKGAAVTADSPTTTRDRRCAPVFRVRRMGWTRGERRENEKRRSSLPLLPLDTDTAFPAVQRTLTNRKGSLPSSTTMTVLVSSSSALVYIFFCRALRLVSFFLPKSTTMTHTHSLSLSHTHTHESFLLTLALMTRRSRQGGVGEAHQHCCGF